MISPTAIVISAQNVVMQTHDHGHDDHAHETGQTLLQETWGLITDPAHALTEIFYSFLFELLIIPVIIYLYKKFREPRLRAQIHKEIDAEHGIQHTDCNSETTPKTMPHRH